MRFVVLSLMTYAALATQVACGEALSFGESRMPLLWLPVVWGAIWIADARGIVWAAVVGLLADNLSDGRFGQQMLATVLALSFALPLRPETDSRGLAPLAVWVFAMLTSIELLLKFQAVVLADGPAVTLMSPIACVVSGVLGVGVWLACASLGRLVGGPFDSFASPRRDAGYEF